MAADAAAAFFSYSREDSEFALRLATDLKDAGAAVWIDQLDIEGGEDWPKSIEAAMRRCPRMIVILSPSCVASDQARAEYHFALDARKKIVPVLFIDCEVPFHLRLFQRVDFRTDYARGLKALLRALGAEQPLASVAPAPPAATPAQPEISAAVAPQRATEQQRLAEEGRIAEQEQLEDERKRAEQGRLEEERRRAAEQAQLDEERKRAEQSRLEQERRLAAGAAEQKQIAQEGAGKALASDWGFLSKAPIWAKVAAAAIGILVVALILYRVSSRQPAWQSGWAVGSGGTILHTADGGQSWEAQSSGTANHLYSIFGSTMGGSCGR